MLGICPRVSWPARRVVRGGYHGRVRLRDAERYGQLGMVRFTGELFTEPMPGGPELRPRHPRAARRRNRHDAAIVERIFTYTRPDPPRGVGAEACRVRPIEAQDGLYQSEHALAHEVVAAQPVSFVARGDLHNQTHVAVDQLAYGMAVAGLGAREQLALLLRAEPAAWRRLDSERTPLSARLCVL